MATTLTQFLALVRERADMETSGFITDSMLTSWLNMAIEELHDRVVAAFGDHFWSTADFTLTGGSVANAQYTLSGITNPTFRYLRWLEWGPGTTARHLVKRWTLGEKTGVNEPRYRLLGAVLQVEPYEYAAGNYRIYYVGNPTALSSGSDAIDGNLDTFRDYVVDRCAIKCREREESATEDLLSDLGRVVARIDMMAAMRDAGNAPRMNDVSEEAQGGQWWRP